MKILHSNHPKNRVMIIYGISIASGYTIPEPERKRELPVFKPRRKPRVAKVRVEDRPKYKAVIALKGSGLSIRKISTATGASIGSVCEYLNGTFRK
jgi:hypothetical protein